MRTLVYVVTLNWNRREDTLECLASLESMTYHNHRILVVDNHSIDGSVRAIAEHHPEVELIRCSENRGFARAANEGIRHALSQGAEYVLLVNNDTIVDPRLLDELLAEAESPEIGIVAPKIYYYAEPRRIWSVGARRNPITLEQHKGGGRELDEGQWDRVLAVDFVTGCGLLLTRRFLEDVGLFDERFFMYYEDSDLSLRASKHGYRLVMTPRARMWHKVSVSSGGRDSPFERYWMGRSSVLFFRTHVQGWRWLIVLPYRTVSAAKTLMRLGLGGQWAAAAAYLRGLRDGFCDGRGQAVLGSPDARSADRVERQSGTT